MLRIVFIFLIAAGTEHGEIELAVKCIKIGSFALGGCLHAGEIVAVQIADIGIQPCYGAAGVAAVLLVRLG